MSSATERVKALVALMDAGQQRIFDWRRDENIKDATRNRGGRNLHADVHDAIVLATAIATLTNRADLHPDLIEAEDLDTASRIRARAEDLRITKEGRELFEAEQAAQVHPVDVPATLPILDWAARWDEETSEEWIVEPLIAERRLIALYSPPKMGKSLLTLELAAAIATGRDVLGTTPRAQNVLYVDFENDPQQDIIKRLKAMGYHPGDLGRLRYLSFPTLAFLDEEQGSQELLAAAEYYQAKIIVIDTVSRAIGGDENENDTWLRFYRHTGLKLKQAGIACVRLDHTGKDVTKGQRGGSAKGGDVDAVWRLSEITKGQVYQLDLEMNRMPITETRLVLHRETDPVLRHRVDASGPGAAFDAKVDAVMDAMDADDLPADAGRTRAAESKKKHGLSAGTQVLEEAVKRRKLRAGMVHQGTLDEA